MTIAVIVLQALLALAYLMAGFTKVSGQKMQVDAFHQYRFPQRFRVFVGTCEIAGAAGLVLGIWIPIFALLAAVGLVILMAGAIYTHIFRQENGTRNAPIPLVLLVLDAALIVLLFVSGRI